MSDPGAALPEPDFPRARLGRVGYDASQVDAFLEQLRRAVRHDPPGMAPYEVADQRFRARRLGKGYTMKPVDDYLDRAQAVLRDRHGEDAVASLEGREPEPKHVRTLWIYLLAVVVAVVIVAVAVSQL